MKIDLQLTMFSLSKEDLNKVSINCVSFAIQSLGLRTMSDEDVAFLVRSLSDDLKSSRYNFLTIEEVRIAFSEGVRGRYDDGVGLNVPRVCKWLDGYLESDEFDRRKYRKADYTLPQLTEKGTKTNLEKKNDILLVVLNQKKKYRSSPECYNIAAEFSFYPALLTCAKAVASEMGVQLPKEVNREYCQDLMLNYFKS